MIVKTIRYNAYVLDLPSTPQISPTFNVADLYEYHPLDDDQVLYEDIPVPEAADNGTTTVPEEAVLHERGNDARA